MSENNFQWTEVEGYAYGQVGENFYRACNRCGGSGRFSFNFQDLDRCYGCGGHGVNGKPFSREEMEKDAHKRGVARRSRERRNRAKEEAEAGARQARILAAAEEAAYEEDAQREQDKVRQAERAQFDYIADEGEKVSVHGQVVLAKYIEAQNYGWSSSMLIVVRVSDTVSVKMFTSAKWAFDLNMGDQIVIDAVVKKNEEYEGKKESQLARPKLKDRQEVFA